MLNKILDYLSSIIENPSSGLGLSNKREKRVFYKLFTSEEIAFLTKKHKIEIEWQLGGPGLSDEFMREVTSVYTGAAVCFCFSRVRDKSESISYLNANIKKITNLINDNKILDYNYALGKLYTMLGKLYREKGEIEECKAYIIRSMKASNMAKKYLPKKTFFKDWVAAELDIAIASVVLFETFQDDHLQNAKSILNKLLNDVKNRNELSAKDHVLIEETLGMTYYYLNEDELAIKIFNSLVIRPKITSQSAVRLNLNLAIIRLYYGVSQRNLEYVWMSAEALATYFKCCLVSKSVHDRISELMKIVREFKANSPKNLQSNPAKLPNYKLFSYSLIRS